MTVPKSHQERNAAHEARLALCTSQVERVAYVCEVLASSGSLASGDVLDMLELYGHLPNRERQKRNVYSLVSRWRKDHTLGDTGSPIPIMTPEMLAILDERAAASEAASEAASARPALSVVPANTGTNTVTDTAANIGDGTNTGTDTANTGTNTDVRAVEEPQVEGTNTTNTPAAPAAETSAPTPADSVRVKVPAASSTVTAATSAADRKTAGKVRTIARRGAYFASLVTLGISAEASLKLFKTKFEVPDPARYFLFAGMEISLVVCGLFMAAGMRSEQGKPGPARLLAWLLCGFAVFASIDLYGPLQGPLRAFVGPILSMLMLHLALGMEFREHHTRESTTMWARLGREWRERFLSRFGLGDDARDAVTRTRDRAAIQLAHLSLAPHWRTPFRTARMRRASRLANVAHDPEMKARVEREHHSLSALGKLQEVKHSDYWTSR